MQVRKGNAGSPRCTTGSGIRASRGNDTALEGESCFIISVFLRGLRLSAVGLLHIVLCLLYHYPSCFVSTSMTDVLPSYRSTCTRNRRIVCEDEFARVREGDGAPLVRRRTREEAEDKALSIDGAARVKERLLLRKRPPRHDTTPCPSCVALGYTKHTILRDGRMTRRIVSSLTIPLLQIAFAWIDVLPSRSNSIIHGRHASRRFTCEATFTQDLSLSRA